jgi:hypothetical protein
MIAELPAPTGTRTAKKTMKEAKSEVEGGEGV